MSSLYCSFLTAVFPARAGMIPTEVSKNPRANGIPRESGDDPYAELALKHLRTYSPRERG